MNLVLFLSYMVTAVKFLELAGNVMQLVRGLDRHGSIHPPSSQIIKDPFQIYLAYIEHVENAVAAAHLASAYDEQVDFANAALVQNFTTALDGIQDTWLQIPANISNAPHWASQSYSAAEVAMLEYGLESDLAAVLKGYYLAACQIASNAPEALVKELDRGMIHFRGALRSVADGMGWPHIATNPYNQLNQTFAAREMHVFLASYGRITLSYLALPTDLDHLWEINNDAFGLLSNKVRTEFQHVKARIQRTMARLDRLVDIATGLVTAEAGGVLHPYVRPFAAPSAMANATAHIRNLDTLLHSTALVHLRQNLTYISYATASILAATSALLEASTSATASLKALAKQPFLALNIAPQGSYETTKIKAFLRDLADAPLDELPHAFTFAFPQLADTMRAVLRLYDAAGGLEEEGGEEVRTWKGLGCKWYVSTHGA